MEDRTGYRVEEIIERAEKIRRQRERNLFVGVSSVVFLLTISLVSAIGATIDCMDNGSIAKGTYGAFLLHRGGDTYVITGLLAFTAGVITTVICIKAHKKQRDNELKVQKYEDEKNEK